MFCRAFHDARERGANRIDLPRIRSVARAWYTDDKARDLSAEQEEVLHHLIDYIGQHGTTDLFALSRQAEGHRLVQELHDLRLIYLVGRQRTIKEQRTRLNQYALDYGPYTEFIERHTHERGGRGVLAAGDAPTLFIPDEALGLPHD
jgi:hypothetical protein